MSFLLGEREAELIVGDEEDADGSFMEYLFQVEVEIWADEAESEAEGGGEDERCGSAVV